MNIVDVAPPSGQPMVTFPNKEYFANHVGKVTVLNKKCVKGLASILPESTPGGGEVIGDVDYLTLIVEDRDIHGVVPITIAINKFIFQVLHI